MFRTESNTIYHIFIFKPGISGNEECKLLSRVYPEGGGTGGCLPLFKSGEFFEISIIIGLFLNS